MLAGIGRCLGLRRIRLAERMDGADLGRSEWSCGLRAAADRCRGRYRDKEPCASSAKSSACFISISLLHYRLLNYVFSIVVIMMGTLFGKLIFLFPVLMRLYPISLDIFLLIHLVGCGGAAMWAMLNPTLTVSIDGADYGRSNGSHGLRAAADRCRGRQGCRGPGASSAAPLASHLFALFTPSFSIYLDAFIPVFL